MIETEITLTKEERFEQDLLDVGRSHGVVLERAFAVSLLKACHRRIKRVGYKPARDQALEDAYTSGGLTTDEEWNAYKHLIDLRFRRRAQEALKLKHRPSSPIEAYEDGHH